MIVKKFLDDTYKNFFSVYFVCDPMKMKLASSWFFILMFASWNVYSRVKKSKLQQSLIFLMFFIYDQTFQRIVEENSAKMIIAGIFCILG